MGLRILKSKMTLILNFSETQDMRRTWVDEEDRGMCHVPKHTGSLEAGQEFSTLELPEGMHIITF